MIDDKLIDVLINSVTFEPTKALKEIKALVIESLGKEKKITEGLHDWWEEGYNQHIAEMREKWG